MASTVDETAKVLQETSYQGKVKIGIIGGSGLDDPDILKDKTEKAVETPYGEPSDVLTLGTIGGVDVVLLARHGKKHTIMPGNVNYRANVYAMKMEGCTHLIVSTACGILREGISTSQRFTDCDPFYTTTTYLFTIQNLGSSSSWINLSTGQPSVTKLFTMVLKTILVAFVTSLWRKASVPRL